MRSPREVDEDARFLLSGISFYNLVCFRRAVEMTSESKLTETGRGTVT